MNNTRRKALKDVVSTLEELLEEINCLIDEEENYRDNMPENLQNSSRYEKAVDTCYSLEEIANNLEFVIDEIGEVIE